MKLPDYEATNMSFHNSRQHFITTKHLLVINTLPLYVQQSAIFSVRLNCLVEFGEDFVVVVVVVAQFADQRVSQIVSVKPYNDHTVSISCRCLSAKPVTSVIRCIFFGGEVGSLPSCS